MRYRADLSFREIAAYLGITHQTVWEHYQVAIVKLARSGPDAQASISRRTHAQT